MTLCLADELRLYPRANTIEDGAVHEAGQIALEQGIPAVQRRLRVAHGLRGLRRRQALLRSAEPLDRVQPLRHLRMPADQRGESAITLRPAGYPGRKLGLLWAFHVVLLVLRVSDPCVILHLSEMTLGNASERDQHIPGFSCYL